MPTLQDLLAVRRAAQRDGEAADVASAPVPADDAGMVAETPFELPAELSAASVPALREALQAWLAQRPPGLAWCLDASSVETIDAAGLQLLLSLASRAAARYVRLRLLQPSTALCAACAALGLAEVLLEPETLRA